ncbi:MAG: hypothetical protein L3J08_09705, partial [Flavobacteriaceae bacterium]|nr:hypothetical protein [Flavobacteriaceae bacterium]
FYKIEAKYFSIALIIVNYFNENIVNPPADEAGIKQSQCDIMMSHSPAYYIYYEYSKRVNNFYIAVNF